ncbi:MAG: oligoendopeptidase F [Syntrophomonadaceae bacterium]
MDTRIKRREEIDDCYKWKLEDIYENEQLWEQDFTALQQMIPEIEKYQGRLGASSAELLQALKLSEQIERKTEKLYVYAKMRRDENNAEPRYQTLFDRIENLAVQVGSASSYIVPEITSISEEKLKAFMDEMGELKVYQHFFQELIRRRQHVLSQEEERLLAMSSDLSVAPGNIFSMLNNADIKFPVIKDEDGKEIELTKGRYGRFMESQDRRVRKEAFEGLYGTYSRLKNTLAATLSSAVKKDVFYARCRKYAGALEAALDQDNVPPQVYHQLIETVHNNLPHMYRYLEIRKKLLGLDELHMYDIYVPMVKDYKMEISFEEAKKTVVKALQPLGSEYLDKLQEGMESGWIDVYENEGKTSGAYSWGAYDTHPYVLLNYDNKLDDMFTLAHEMGHALHSYYSHQAQPHVYSQYSIFVAEVASTVNESLLIDYLLAQSERKEEKMYLLNHYLEQFRGTVYRQTMFAEFEKIIHEMVEQGAPLTPDSLNRIYRELNELYYGPDVVIDKEIEYEWARIPHFYSGFYVYKYATGFSAATALKQKILNEGQPAVERYLEFLKGGGSNYPIELLKKAGVDLTSPLPVQEALQYFGRLVEEMGEISR